MNCELILAFLHSTLLEAWASKRDPWLIRMPLETSDILTQYMGMHDAELTMLFGVTVQIVDDLKPGEMEIR